MIATMSNRIDRWASGRLVLALILAFVVFEAVTLPILQRSPGGDIEPLDARFFYTPQDAYITIGAYGNARPSWIGAYLTWDIVNPLLYTLVFSLAISWLFRRAFESKSWIRNLNIVPVGAGLFDLLENLCIVILMATYPAEHAFVAWMTTLCTMSKVSLLGVSTLLILTGLIKAAASRLRMQAP